MLRHDAKPGMEPAPENEVTGEITPGITTFRSHYVDSNPLWKVIRQDGQETWLCEVIREKVKVGGEEYWSEVYVGTKKAFLTREIIRSMGENLMSEHDRFYASLKPGSIVHYKTGFDQWVRCTVEGKNKLQPIVLLQPIALLGPWSKNDLPRRMRDGSIDLGHYGKKIINRSPFELMRSDFTHIYESGSKAARPRNGIPPTILTPIDLSVPPQTPEEAQWVRIGEIKEKLKSGDNPTTILDEVRRLIDQPY